jgi:hypothetical protein
MQLLPPQLFGLSEGFGFSWWQCGVWTGSPLAWTGLVTLAPIWGAMCNTVWLKLLQFLQGNAISLLFV